MLFPLSGLMEEVAFNWKSCRTKFIPNDVQTQIIDQILPT